MDKLAGKRKAHIRADYNLDFPLRVFVSCSICNKPITGAWTKGRNPNKKFPYYWCRNKNCPNRYKIIQKKTLEDSFEKLLKENKVQKEIADLINVIFLRVWKEVKDNYTLTCFERERKVKQISEMINKLSERVSITNDEHLTLIYENKIKEMLQTVKNLEKDNIKVAYTESQFQTASNLVFSALKEPVKMWKSKEYENKTTIIRMYFNERISYDLKEGFQTPKLEPTINLINNLDPSKNTLVEMAGIEPASEKTLL